MMHSLLKAALLAVFFLSHSAWASCTAGSVQTTTVQVLSGSAKVKVPQNSPVGTTVWTSPTITTPAVSVTCNGQGYGVVATGLPVSGMANVYQTGISYLGVKIVEVSSFAAVNTTPTRWTTPAFNFSGTLSTSYQVSLVVITPVPSSGNVNSSSSISGPIAQDYISDAPDAVSANARELHRLQLGSFNTSVTGGAPCTPSDLTVDLGNHKATEFSGVGTTTAPTSFTIVLTNCPAGMSRITYQLDPVTTVVPGTGNSVVTLNAGATATGVGVQLLDQGGAPLALASQQTISNSGGTYSIPLQARYYESAASVGGGSANAAVTFTITYN